MLFHITQTHTPDNCPYGKGGSRSLHDANAEGVKLVAMYGAFTEHVIYLVVEADSLEAVHRFLLPGLTKTVARITPVVQEPIPL